MSPHHIPFPRNFLSLNTPVKKAAVAPPNDVPATVTSPAAERTPHTFLSNRPIDIPGHGHTSRQSSVSSISSVDSTTSSPPAGEPASSPVLNASFLALNTKHEAPPPPAKQASVVKSGFLSNRH